MGEVWVGEQRNSALEATVRCDSHTKAGKSQATATGQSKGVLLLL